MIPEKVLCTIRMALARDKDSRLALLRLHPNESFLEEKIQDIDNALLYLDALPKPPQPNWSQVPDWAQWWAVDANGLAHWWKDEPRVSYAGAWSGFNWYATGKVHDIPLGTDWRTLKVKRPEIGA